MDPASSPTGSNGQGLYQCSQCQRTYTRIDHLDRHIRSHLHERPFQCHVCNKSFGRVDILKRHTQGHVAGKPTKRQRSERYLSRVSEACSACALAKLKCDENKPCARCRQLDIQCEHSGDARFSTRGAPARPEQSDPDPSTTQEAEYSQHTLNMPSDEQGHRSPTPSALLRKGASPQFPPMPFADITNNESPSAGFPDNQFSDFLRDVLAQEVPTDFAQYDHSTWPGARLGSRGLLDFTTSGYADLQDNDGNYFLGDLQSGQLPLPVGQDDLLRTHHMPVPAQTAARTVCYDNQQPPLDPAPAVSTHAGTKGQAGIGVEAFRRSSLSRWLPAQQDGLEAELNQLSKISGEADSPDSRSCLASQGQCEPLQSRTRDLLLVTVLAVRGQGEASAVASTFPSCELLDGLIRVAIAHQQRSSSSPTHMPTFNPNTLNMTLLAAVIAEGAILSDNIALQRFGFVIQEVVRIGIHKNCEASNAITREFWLLQASRAEMDIGLWSGNRRKMEIAESHTQVLITLSAKMIRRAGGFQKSAKPAPAPLSCDSGDCLEEKWLAWVRQESYRRLAFEVFLYDAQVSMSLFSNPLISYAEMALPLPESRELWSATNAEQWKSICLNQSGRPTEQPNLPSLLQQPLDVTVLRGSCDLRFSILVALHGLWALIWEHTQLTSITGNRQVYSQAAISLRHQELCSALEQLRVAIADLEEVQTPQIILTLELLSMYLHISLEKIQLFAGKEDLEEARRVLPYLHEWVDTSPSRQAIWHAGQILGAARDLEPGALRAFHAIAVYHASLTCWTYGLVSQMRTPQAASAPAKGPSAGALVPLDGAMSGEVQKLIALGRGTPCIGFARQGDPACKPVPLSDSAAFMASVRQILRGDPSTGVAPPLNENLGQLVMELGYAGSSVAGAARYEAGSHPR